MQETQLSLIGTWDKTRICIDEYFGPGKGLDRRNYHGGVLPSFPTVVTYEGEASGYVATVNGSDSVLLAAGTAAFLTDCSGVLFAVIAFHSRSVLASRIPS
jgi:hypothetical protein